MEDIVNTLFSTHPVREKLTTDNTETEIPFFTITELRKAVSAMKNNKAPGPDRIPAEISKWVVEICPNLLLRM